MVAYLGHKGITRAVRDHLETNVPLQLAAMRLADPDVLVEDPKAWWAHERFSGSSGINKTNSPAVMVTTDGVVEMRHAGTDRPGSDESYDSPVTVNVYQVRVIVGVHAPDGADSFQDVFDARSDLLLAVRNTLLLYSQVAPLITVSHQGMSEVAFSPTDPETVRSYLEGQLAFRVTAQETAPLPILGTVETAPITISIGT